MIKDYLYNLATDKTDGFMARLVKCVLLLFSTVYRLLVWIRTSLFEFKILKQRSLSVPVISVGNITWGGSGKTPLVIEVLKCVNALHKKSAVLSRGYKGADEAKMIRIFAQAEVVVGANRFAVAKEYLERNHVDCFVLDDGYQHVQLKRDLNILVIDSLEPFGNTHLIPRGILREDLRAIKRADFIVLSKVNWCHESKIHDIKKTIKMYSLRPVLESSYKATHLLNLRSQIKFPTQMSRQNIVAFSAIGSPSSFEKSLQDCGGTIKKYFIFEDHHRYTQSQIKNINAYCLKNKIKTVVTTDKDAVKLNNLLSYFDSTIDVFSLQVEMEIIQGKDLLVARIVHLLLR